MQHDSGWCPTRAAVCSCHTVEGGWASCQELHACAPTHRMNTRWARPTGFAYPLVTPEALGLQHSSGLWVLNGGNLKCQASRRWTGRRIYNEAHARGRETKSTRETTRISSYNIKSDCGSTGIHTGLLVRADGQVGRVDTGSRVGCAPRHWMTELASSLRLAVASHVRVEH